MNGRRAKALRAVSRNGFSEKEANAAPEFLPRRAQRRIIGYGGPQGPITRVVLLPIRLKPGPRHVYRHLKRAYNARINKKLPVSFFPRRGW